MTKRYKLRIPDGCEVESVNSTTINGKDAILVLLAPVFNPQPGDYVATKDGQVGIMTANGIWKFANGIYPFDRYANETQKEVFYNLLKNEALRYNPLTQNVEGLFSNGDIIAAGDNSHKWIAIYKSRISSKYLDYHSMLSVLGMSYNDKCLSSGFRYATDSEKKLLFDAMEKDGRYWDSETMEIKKKCKSGDLCIFWDNDHSQAIIAVLQGFFNGCPKANYEIWDNCIPFENGEQYKSFIKSK